MIGNRLSTAARIAYAMGLAPSWEDGGTAWSIAAVSAGYVFADGDEFLDAIDPGDLLGTVALTGNAVLADGACDTDDLSIPATDGETWAALWLFIDTGDPATSTLWGWMDTQGDDTALTGVVSGGSIDVTIPATGLFRL